jgi:lysophospholipase L1-like esterase
MELFSFFIGTVFAFEGIISPLPDEFTVIGQTVSKPTVSFQSLSSQNVLGVTTDQGSPSASATIFSKTKNEHMTIALIGDSMVDTLGVEFPELTTLLTAQYPRSKFSILNYGVGGTNIDYGIERLANGYEYLGVHHPSLISQKPDLVIIESFGYNPYSYDTGAIDAHWLALAKIVDIIKTQLPGSKIAIAATIAPNNQVFGDGAAGISFSSDDKRKRTTVINGYLESTVKFAQSQHIPLMDAYHPSQMSDGNGTIDLINNGDHIHYSPKGREFMARIMTDTITREKLLE